MLHYLKYYIKKNVDSIEKNLKVNPSQLFRFVNDKKCYKMLPSIMTLGIRSADNPQDIAELFASNFSTVYSESVVVPNIITYNLKVELSELELSEHDVIHGLGTVRERRHPGQDGIAPNIFERVCLRVVSSPHFIVQ